jgi:hypothetical protein
LESRVTESAASQTNDAHPGADLIEEQGGAAERVDLICGSVAVRDDERNSDPEDTSFKCASE